MSFDNFHVILIASMLGFGVLLTGCHASNCGALFSNDSFGSPYALTEDQAFLVFFILMGK